ncbi:MAG TPA: GTPase, partial [Anaerolineae bacterium]|nr:GTPase [Anaerolineae bacterium]
MSERRIRVVIMGAAGRDFHNFNVYFRDNPTYEVVAFTATQIPNIEGRRYPPELAGELYPDGIPVYPEAELATLIREREVDQVVFSYSDVPHEYVMHRGSLVVAAGADFRLMGSRATMLQSSKPVIAVCAVRTGCGKSQTTRYVSDLLQEMGKKVVVVRHPMPYGDLAAQRVQRFASYADLDRYKCTIEERE